MLQVSVSAVRAILHPEAQVHVFRHGHAAPAERGGADIDRLLSEQGRMQAETLGKSLKKRGVEFDQIISSGARRAKDTAAIACADSECYAWYMGKGLELYSPANPLDHRALIELEKALNQNAMPEVSYAVYRKADTIGLFARFMTETMRVISAIPRIGGKRRVAIFAHAVMGNAIAETLFPQYLGKIAEIELQPCDGIKISRGGCEHIPHASMN